MHSSLYLHIISIFHGCMVLIEISVTRVTERHHEACRTVIPSDMVFYPHHTPVIDTFSYIPFDLSHLIFKSRTRCRVILFSLKSFYTSLKKPTLPVTAVRFFTLTSNLLKETSLFDVSGCKNQRHLTT